MKHIGGTITVLFLSLRMRIIVMETTALKRFFVLNFLLFILCAFPFYIHAQDSTGIKLQPSLIEERADPGSTFTSTIRVTNLSKDTATYFFLKRDILRIDDNVPVFANEGEPTGFELSSWVTLPGESVTVPAGETREVVMTIRVPDDANPGSHFGGVFLVLKAPKLRETGTGVGYQVGTIISLRIAGDVSEEARIRDFFTDRLVYGTPEVVFTSTVENAGNTIVRPRGQITINNIFGKKIAVERINEATAAVLPGQNRSFQATWKPKDFTFGRYEAMLDLLYGEDGRKTISSATSFWILPIRIILPVAVGLLLFVGLIYLGMRIHIRRKVASLMGPSSVRLADSRRAAPLSRLTVVTVALLAFTALFLLVLLFFFA